MIAFLGCFISVCSTVIGALGKLMIRWAWSGYIESADDNSIHTTRMLYLRLVLGYFSLLILDPICTALSLALAPPIYTAPMKSLSLIWIVLLSERILNEKPDVIDYSSICMISIGTLIILGTSIGVTDVNYDISVAVDMFKSYDWRLYQFINIAWICSLLFLILLGRPGDLMHKFGCSLVGGSLAGNLFYSTLMMHVLLHDPSNVSTFTFAGLGLAAVGVQLAGVSMYSYGVRWYPLLFMSSAYIGSYIFTSVVSNIWVLYINCLFSYILAFICVICGVTIQIIKPLVTDNYIDIL